jgi:hypothetical protein
MDGLAKFSDALLTSTESLKFKEVLGVVPLRSISILMGDASPI